MRTKTVDGGGITHTIERLHRNPSRMDVGTGESQQDSNEAKCHIDCKSGLGELANVNVNLVH